MDSSQGERDTYTKMTSLYVRCLTKENLEQLVWRAVLEERDKG